LRYLLNRFHGNLSLALAAYNAGEYRLKRYQQIQPIRIRCMKSKPLDARGVLVSRKDEKKVRSDVTRRQ
jgi:hypothetical protein